MFPNEIWCRIFEYDPTYKHLFRKCLDEIPDIQIAKANKYHYNDSLKRNNNRRTFHLDSISGPVPYIYLSFQEFSFFGNFTKMDFINTDNQDRFIYNNGSITDARKDGIDTRLRPWEWWIKLYYNNSTTLLSCNYQQMHGVYIEIKFEHTQTSLSKMITEPNAIALYKEIKDALIQDSVFKYTTIHYKDFPIYHTQGIIPNATIRTFDFSPYLIY
tara:strand:- start:4391 stop:5035 length:645 start_codon:yes stop_codon:yes gene_type:complete